jgi:hypothetical protein
VERRKDAVIAECNATVAAIIQLRKFCQARMLFEASKVTLAAAVEALKARGFEAGCVVVEQELLQKDMTMVPAPRKSSAQAPGSTATATTHPDVSNNAGTISDDNKSAGGLDSSVEVVNELVLPDIDGSPLKVNEDDDNSEVEEEDFVPVPETEVSAPFNTKGDIE